MKIKFDMDGVVSNFLKAALAKFNTTIEEVYSPPHAKGVWEVETLLGVSPQVFWETVGEDAFYDLEVIEDGMQVYKWLVEQGHDVSLCTAPTNSPKCFYHKALWVQKHLPELFPEKLCIYSEKYELANADTLLIDDSDKNCEAFRKSGGQAIVFPRPWNSMHTRSHEAELVVIKNIHVAVTNWRDM